MEGDVQIFPNYENPVELFRVNSTDEDTWFAFYETSYEGRWNKPSKEGTLGD
jgi:hypothetical protein